MQACLFLFAVFNMKLIGACFPDGVYPVQGEKPGTTLWLGNGIRFFMDIALLMNISIESTEIESKPSPSNVTHPFIQTLVDGRADVFMGQAGMTHSRHQFIDFSSTMIFTETQIFSKNQVPTISYDFLASTFDAPTFTLTILSIAAVALASWIILRARGGKLSLIATLFFTYSSALGLGLPDCMILDTSLRQKFLYSVHGLMTQVLTKSFSGIIIASLLSRSTPPQIDSLWDVAENPNLKIITASGTFWYRDLMSHPAIERLKHRIEIRPMTKKSPEVVEQALQEVSEGSHVLIGYHATLPDLVKRSPNFFEEQFHVSDPITARPLAYGVPKIKSEDVKKFEMGTYWMVAFGHFGTMERASEEYKNSRGILQNHEEGNEYKRNCPRLSGKDQLALKIAKAKKRSKQPGNDAQTVLEIRHFRYAFNLFFIGIGSSILVLILELLVFWYSN